MSKPAARDKSQETAILMQDAVDAVDAMIEAEAVQAEPAAEAPALEALMATMKAMQDKIDRLEGRQTETYPDDESLFIAKPSGEQWSDRVLDVATKSYVEVQMSATAFYGPFASNEAISAYIGSKKGKRPNDGYEWDGVRTVTGREKRTIEAQERADRERQGGGTRITNYFGGR